MNSTDPAAPLEVPAEAGFRASAAGDVVTITLDRPEKRNSQTPHTWSALGRLADSLPPATRVVVLRGAGPSFSAGLDRAMFAPDGVPGAPGVTALAAMTQQDATDAIAGWQRAFDWMSRPDVVSIAAVQGHAVGAGCQLALGADIRLLTENAALSLPEPRLGLVPDLGGTKRLVDLVGYSRAAEIVLTGRVVLADEALRIGLASRVVPVAELDAAVDDTVTALLAVDRDAAREAKALLMAAATRTQPEQERAEREAQYRRLRKLAGLPD